ncbi:unnamed protein product [Rotaria socialis]|uniref:Uncharacterized protein n=1 Tax=Rotaria socialis TaxID=392032 RepID=A0A817TX64_9BILA|nr:unnamed protein product [Rotaria socialis]CAF3392919.1 unnamed protein product [Rotaria socialis]CAF3425940.1 unnamed protein product [Rotaria socialis]CAF3472360.1 unnamed protein product [Rotaria socialis]CAF4337883.1 unnamed protein product [Rotaria socialis]
MIERLLAPTPPTQLTEHITESQELTPTSLVDYDIVGNNTLILGEKDCISCGLIIKDESYLRVHKHGIFHENCLTCYICHRSLITIGGGYFIRNGYDQQSHFICRHDYQIANNNKSYRSSSCSMYLPQCSKCQTIISANELVMRTDDKYIYHIDCFTCCLCNVVLKPGDDYGLHGSLLFCRLHLEQTTNTTFSLCSPIKAPTTANINIKKSRQNGTTTQRKQRTKLNNLENNTNNLEITAFLHGNDLSNSDGNFSSTIFNNSTVTNPQQRTKRNRTSFKHHQLRIMKTFFAQNHNPDSKGLKILSQKTQLSKRVLQVWFQNARAKLRRGLLQEQENKQQKASTSIDNNNSSSASEFLQLINDDDITSGTSNDRSRTEDEEIIDELDDYDNNQNNDSSTTINTHEFNHLMPPYSMYPLL